MTSNDGWTERAEETQPWVIYAYGRTHDKWWPIWSSTRLLGIARIGLECMVCGTQEVATLSIPRVGRVPEPVSGRHEARERFLVEHAHPDRGHPMSWVRPLRNLNAHAGGLNIEQFAMRLETDLNHPDAKGGSQP